MERHTELLDRACRRTYPPHLRSYLAIVLPATFTIIPLVIGIAWGAYLDDGAYLSFRHARDLSLGRETLRNLTTRTPLYVLVLSLLSEKNIPLPDAGLILSAAGWSVTVAAIYSAGRAIHRRVAAVVSMALLSFNPIIVQFLGTETSWVTASIWLAIAATRKKRWGIQTGLLVLMLCIHFDLNTIAMALFMLILQGVHRRTFPILPGLILAATIIGLGTFAFQAEISLYPELGLAEWQREVRSLTSESEFYWLFLPFVGLGMLAAQPVGLWLGAMGGLGLILTISPTSIAIIVTLALFLTGLGIEQIAEWSAQHNLLRLDRLKSAASLAIIGMLPLTVAQATSMYQRYQLRSIAQQRVEQQAAAWLCTNSRPTATVFGSDRIGYLADRPTRQWDGGAGTPQDSMTMVENLATDPPDYCISLNSIPWDRLIRTSWFQDHYERLLEFSSAYDSTSPHVIWKYHSSPFDQGEYRALDVRLPDEVRWVGYRYWPDHIEPGKAVHVTLFLQTTQSIGDSVQAAVYITSPHDGATWAHRETVSRRSVLKDWWETRQIIVDQFVLTTTADIPIGAYHLNVSIMTPALTQIVPMYRGDDTSPVDRVTLGNVIVPWQGSLNTVKQANVRLGNGILLRGFDVVDSLPAGDELKVTLYWEAWQPLAEDYVVFVHLMDESGRLIASHDGPPASGRYATSAWLPGDIVQDTHILTLEPDTPGGLYQLKVGMYTWPGLERLPVWNELQEEQPERVIYLQSIVVQ